MLGRRPKSVLAYINDLPGSVRSRVRLFADDTIVYLTIKSHTSAQSLHEDWHQLELKGKKWSIELNPDKCEVLRIHRKKKPVIFLYTLHDTTLRTTENTKYLGDTISSNLKRSSHINTITNKAKSRLRFIRWNVKTQNKQLKEDAYRAYVRPQVEYCSTIWHPWQKHLTQNGNGLTVSRKLCSKWLHKQCHKHAQRVKVVYSWATQNSSHSIVLLNKLQTLPNILIYDSLC